MTAATRWILIVVGLLAGNTLAVVVLMTAAGGDTERRVVPDYYQRAAAWDDVLAAAEASANLGWDSDVVVRGREVELTLRDGAGAPVEGAVVIVKGGPRAHADETTAVTLVAAAPGRYVATWPGRRGGLHQLALTAARGPDHWVTERLVELAPAAGTGP